MLNLKTRNIGKFKVSSNFFNELELGQGVNLFFGMVVLKAAFNVFENNIEYIAIHEDFEESPEGMIIPEYKAAFVDGCAYPIWEKVKQ